MGTRNLTLVQLNNEYRVAQYGQWDGYPSYTGINILKFLRTMDKNKFIEKLKNTKFITKQDYHNYWMELGIDIEKEKLVDISTSNKFDELHPTLSRDMGFNVLNFINESDDIVNLWNDYTFAKNSLFCEWAYLINLDENTLEVYKGFNKTKLTKEDRFYFDGYVSDSEYYPIKLVKTYSLDELPTDDDFVKELESDE